MLMRKGHVLTIVGVAVIIYLYSSTDFSGMARFDLRLIWLYLPAVLAIELLLVLRWMLILRTKGVDIRYMTLFLYRQAGYAVGYITPQMHIGDSSTRLLLLRHNGIGMKKGLASILVDRAMTITTDAILAIIGVLLLLLAFGLPEEMRMALAFGAAAIGFAFGLLYHRILSGKTFIVPIIRIIPFLRKHSDKARELEVEISSFFTKDKKTFLACMLINLLLWVLMFLEYKAALLMLGYDAGLVELFLVVAFVGITYSMPVPFAAGVLEAGQYSIAGLIGSGSAVALGLSVLIRIKDLIRTGAGLAVLSILGIRTSKT